MSIITPSVARYKSKFTGDKLQITIPARRHWYQILFLGVWLIGWSVGEIVVSSMLIGGLIGVVTGDGLIGASFPVLFMIVWLAFWTAGGALAIYALAWQISGKEKIIVDNDGLTIRRGIGPWSRAKIYQRKHLLNLRVSPEPFSYNNFKTAMRFWGIGGGVLAFDYGAKTIRFGSGMEEAEANMILAEIQQHFPLYKSA